MFFLPDCSRPLLRRLGAVSGGTGAFHMFKIGLRDFDMVKIVPRVLVSFLLERMLFENLSLICHLET